MFCVACKSIAFIGCQVVTGWMEMRPLFHLLRVLQLLVFLKTFRLYKPVMAMGSWLELQHWGNSFHSLLGDSVSLPVQDEEQVSSDDRGSSQLQN